MRSVAILALLAGCGGGGSPVTVEPPTPAVEYVETLHHRIGLRNDWILSPTYVDFASVALLPDGSYVARGTFWTPHFTHGAVWEAPEGFDVPDGFYNLAYDRPPGGAVHVQVEYVRGVKDAKVVR